MPTHDSAAVVRALKRPEDLLTAVLLVILAIFARGYYPTLPVGAWILTGALALLAAVFGIRAWLPRPQSRGWGRRLLHGLWGIPLVAVLAFMIFHSVVLAFILGSVGTVVVVLLHLPLALWIWRGHRSGRASGPRLRALVAIVIFLDAFAYIPLCAWMWRSPDLARCEALAQVEHVHRLSPASWSQRYSYPYELEVIPARDTLTASFKMAGNLTIRPWDRPEANRILVVEEASQPVPRPHVLALPGELMPQYMAYDAGRDELIFNRLGFGVHSVDFLPLASAPELRLRRSVSTPRQVHAMRVVDDGALLAMATMDNEVITYDLATGEERDRLWIYTWFWDPGFTITDATSMGDSPFIYASMLGTGIVRVDPTRPKVLPLKRTVGFGAGEIIGHVDTRRLYQTEFFFGALKELDSRTLTVERTIDLGYSPRSVAVDPQRDLLFVGDWFGGRVHTYRRSTLEPALPPVDVGPYLRELAWDPVRRVLYTGSKCGVYRVEMSAQLAEAGL